jgi:drug/metabolite transporter (DMT)-like permease
MIFPARMRDGATLIALAPLLFVLLWSTGFIAMKQGIAGAGPLTFLALRFVLVAALLVAACVLLRVRWRMGAADMAHAAVVGVLFHVVYIGSVGEALLYGISAGVVALVAGLQPLITAALVGRLLGETVSRLQWLGLVLGLSGIAMVVSAKLSIGEASVPGFGFAVLCLAGITAGTLYQKRFCAGHDMLSSMTVQFVTAAVVTVALATTLEDMQVSWSAEFVFALLWLTIVTSIGAFALLFLMLRHRATARVTSLFYLTPPTTAVMGYLLFSETLAPLALFGMAVAVGGVALASR